MGFVAMPQVEISSGDFLARADLALHGLGVLLEFDGFVKYSRADPYGKHSTPGEVVFAEKVREDRIRDLGYEVVRVTWSDFEDLPALRRRIEAAVARARARRGLATSGAREE